MKIVFVSNYYNHHQSSFSEELFKLTKGDFYFIQTQPIERERVELGWKELCPNYVKISYLDDESYDECLDLINSADVVIAGNAPNIMFKQRMKAKKLVFRYSERIYKRKSMEVQIPLRFIKYHIYNYGNPNVYLLSASAYAAGDYAKTFNYINKSYRWGYFPKEIQYDDIDALIGSKDELSILWVSRFIDWKHPEKAIDVAKKLRRDGYRFTLNLIGTGNLHNHIQRLIDENKLNDNVRVLGAMTPEKVRFYMEKSKIFIFTSDRNEGWGAVLNEAMNSACAVVANHEIGSVPFLIGHQINGLEFNDHNDDDLYKKVKYLFDNPQKQIDYGIAAYNTILQKWNSRIAATRFVELSSFLLSSSSIKCNLFDDGPCSSM